METLRIIQEARNACSDVAYLQDNTRNAVLHSLISALKESSSKILEANTKDLNQFEPGNPMIDRLLLDEKRIDGICESIRTIATFDSPVGKILDRRKMPNGLHIERVFVPLGLVSVVYESRPNVTIDVFTLCFKSGNACILKGGKEAFNTNLATLDIMRGVLRDHGINENAISMVSCDRSNVGILIKSPLIDVCIPRGGKSLVNFVRCHAEIPVIETGAGVVHAYFDASGDLEKGKRIILNSKCRRVAVCNALDCLLIHKDRLSDLPSLVKPMEEHKVEILADDLAYNTLQSHYTNLSKAKEEDFGFEFLCHKLAVCVVESFDHAIDYISRKTSSHTECIIAEDKTAIERFLKKVDAGVLYSNVATSFSDGGEFGMGGEMGISTQKLHVRGPFALEGLVSYKWLVRGDGQIRD